jgi:hypothetical protein
MASMLLFAALKSPGTVQLVPLVKKMTFVVAGIGCAVICAWRNIPFDPDPSARS